MMKNPLVWLLALMAASWCQQSAVVVVLAQQRQPCSGVVFESAKASTISAAMLETTTTSDGTGGNEYRHDAVVEVRYKGSAPTRRFFLSAKYHYEQRVALPDCVTPLSDDNNAAITPAVTGEIPDTDFDAEAGVLATKIYLDTEAIRNTPDLWTPSAAFDGDGTTRGTIEFCVLANLYSDRKGDVAVASEAVRVALDVDAPPPNDAEADGMVAFMDESYTRATTGDGTHDGHHQNHDYDDNSSQQVTTASVNEPEEQYEIDQQGLADDDSSPVVVEYCDDANRPVTPAPTLFPGDVLQVCVRTGEEEKDTSDATDTTTTLNVCSVAFANSLSNLYVEVIDGKGKETNSAIDTLKTCTLSVCNIKVVTVESLYPYEDDVNAGATTFLVGKALLKKNSAGPRGRRHLEEATTVTKFAMDLQDSLVPLPGGSTRKASSFSFQSKRGAMTCALAASVAVALVLVAVLVFASLLRRRRQNSDSNGTLPTTAKTTEGGAHVDGSDASATTLEADRSSDDGSSTMANTVDDSL